MGAPDRSGPDSDASPDTNERRPRPGSGAQNNQTATSLSRRRREASLRLPPVGNGPSDPLDRYQLSDAEVLQAAREYQDRWLAVLAAKGIHMDGCLGVEFTAAGGVKPCCRERRTGAP